MERTQRKPSLGLFANAGKRPEPSKPRPALPAPEPEPEPEAPPKAPETTPDDKAEVTPVRLYRRQRERLESMRTRLAPGVRLSRSAVVRWLIDHWPN